MQKKRINFFSNCKNKHAKKKHKIIFQKDAKKKDAKKAGGVYSVIIRRDSKSRLPNVAHVFEITFS